MLKKFKISVILFLISLNLTLRAPNEWLFNTTGSDAHAYEFLTLQLINNGYLIWVLSPLSYFGMYPYSYASGPMVFTGSILLVTGLKTDIVILIYSLFNSILGTFFAFFIGRIFFKKNILPAIIIAMSYTLNHYFLLHTLWRYSTRGMFMSLLPVLLWYLLKSVNSFNRLKYFSLSIIFFTLLLTIHRMNTYATVTILFPFLIFHFATFFIPKIKIKAIFNYNSSKYFLILSSLIIFVTLIEFTDYYINLGFPIRKTWLFDGYDHRFFGVYLNVFRTYSERGLLLFLALPGMIYLFSKPNKQYHEIYFIFILFSQLLWILDVEYFLPIFSITLSILTGYGFISLINVIKSREQAFAFCIIFIFIIPIGFTSFQRDIATRIQIERDWPIGFDGTENDDTSLWRSKYIKESEMILSDSTEVHKLGSNGKMALLEDNMIIWLWKNVSNNLVVEPLSILDIFFQQPENHYGGKVSDWATGDSDIRNEKHESHILWMVEIRPSYENLIEYYELRWIFTINRDEWKIDYPFIQLSLDTSYTLYSNELFTILYHDSW